MIKAIMAESGARIQMQQKDEVMPGATERGVDITGTETQVSRAHQVCLPAISLRWILCALHTISKPDDCGQDQ